MASLVTPTTNLANLRKHSIRPEFLPAFEGLGAAYSGKRVRTPSLSRAPPRSSLLVSESQVWPPTSAAQPLPSTARSLTFRFLGKDFQRKATHAATNRGIDRSPRVVYIVAAVPCKPALLLFVDQVIIANRMADLSDWYCTVRQDPPSWLHHLPEHAPVPLFLPQAAVQDQYLVLRLPA